MNEYDLDSVINDLDFEKNSLKTCKNGLLLTNYEIEVLDKYKIDFNKTSSLKEILYLIDEVLEKFKGDTLQIDTYWSGNTGDMVKERLTKYTNKFDFISNRLEGYILYLEKVALEYETEDSNIDKAVSGDVPETNS